MNYHLVILGAGESGIGAALLAKQQGISVFVSDGNSIAEKYKIELQENDIAFEEAQHTDEIILNAKEVIKSPGIPHKVSIIKKIQEKNIPIISEIEFAFRYKGKSKIIAITGSNGKTTTTSLIYFILKNAGYNVSMCGNIGYSFAKQICIEPTQWYVVEISSFQLDDIVLFKPDIAILLNITPDHLDRYNYNFNEYAAAKFKIAKNQTAQNYFVVCADDMEINKQIKELKSNPKIILFTMKDKIETEGAYMDGDRMIVDINGELSSMSINELSLVGKHNVYNSMASGISASIAGIRKEKIRECLSTFDSLEHRLEKVINVRGVEFINDSKATNVNSVWYALESMKKPTILILGGVDKGNDYSIIKELVAEKVKAIVCMGLDNTLIHQNFEDIGIEIIDTKSATEAVASAYKLAKNGDVVLLSPACASFDLFKNYEDRGTQFKQAVKAL